MNNSAFKKYTNKYYNIVEQQENQLPTPFINTLGASALISGLLPVAIPAIAGAIDAIRTSVNNFKYDKFGCKRVVDQIARNNCEARALDRHITDLRNKMVECNKTNNPQACKQKINQEIIKKMQDKQELKNLTVLADTGSQG
jgi:hypothetical protein